MTQNEKQLTVIERMISAMTGSLLTSIMLTPMDVVRIRLQQQGMLPDCTCEPVLNSSIVSSFNMESSLSKVTVSTLSKSDSINSRVKELFWEGPCFEDLKCNRNVLRFNGTWDAFRKIAQNEGITTLWRGISLTLFMSVPANIVYFTGYEYIRDISPLRHQWSTINPLFCGGLARIIAATTVAPIELIKTKFQSIPRSTRTIGSTKMFQELLLDTKMEIARNGVMKTLFKGLTITLWRDVPFSAIYWGSYEYCKRKLWVQSRNQSNYLVDFLNSFLSGSISGMVAAFVTHPFDVGKTRLQISMFKDDEMIKENRGRLVQSRDSIHHLNMFKYLNMIRRNEGVQALYAGLGPRIVKIAPSCAIMISTYEISKKFF